MVDGVNRICNAKISHIGLMDKADLDFLSRRLNSSASGDNSLYVDCEELISAIEGSEDSPSSFDNHLKILGMLQKLLDEREYGVQEFCFYV